MWPFGNNQEKKNAYIMAPQWTRICSDCVNLINKTTSIEVYCKRYDLLIENLQKLVSIENLVKFNGTMPSKSLLDIKSKRKASEHDFIDRYIVEKRNKLLLLKTQKAKDKTVDNIIQEFETYKNYFSKENLDYLTVTIKQLQEISGDNFALDKELFKELIQNCKSLNTDLVEASYFNDCTKEQSLYRGRVFSLSGKDKRFPQLTPEVLKSGLDFDPFIYGISEPIYNSFGINEDIIKFSNKPSKK